MTNVNIEDVSAVLADEGYADQNGVRRVDSPRFIFFDDERESDPELSAFRDDLLAFEEWNAAREAPTDETLKVGIFTVHRCIREWYDADGRAEDFHGRQEARGLCNWLVDNARRRVPTNDHWRKLVMPLTTKLDDPELGGFAQIVLSTLKRELPFAPGPVKGTVFKNPDGSRYETMGTDYGKARASFITRHKLDEEFVSAERVQYEGDRGSKIVVGVRRSSETTMSRYYDPNPAWQDNTRKTGYLPNAAAFLIMLDPASPVMPSGSHRLTVREFEQAIIAGCEILDDECESTACELEAEYLPDARVVMINVGYGNAQYDPMIFSHEEEYLMGVFRRFAKDADDSFWKDACEKMLLREEAADLLRDHFHAQGKPTPQLVDLLDFVSWSDENTPSEAGPYLPYVLSVLVEYGSEEYTSPTAESYSDAVVAFDDDEHAWEIPTATGVRLCTFRNWK
jgi:hypothetical protein